MPAIQVPPPSGKATTETGPSFFSKQVPMGIVLFIAGGSLLFGFGVRGFFGGKAAPPPAVVVAKPAVTAPAPAVVVVPVQAAPQAGQPAVTPTEPKPADTTAAVKPPAGTEAPSGTGEPAGDNPEAGLWRPAKKVAAPKPHKIAAADTGTEDAMLGKPKAAVVKEPKPVVAKEPKPTTTASAKPAKKPAKAWVDPFAN
jgi:hypothetical protein